MKRSYLFLSPDFEEIEALSVVDILRRAEVDIQMVSMTGGIEVVGSHGITVKADMLFEQIENHEANYLVLPGGSTMLNNYEQLKMWLVEHNNNGGAIAAICAAPMVLGGLGLVDGRQVTCYPGFESYMNGAILVDKSVVVDGLITTANGPGASMAFALELVAQIKGDVVARNLANALQYPTR